MAIGVFLDRDGVLLQSEERDGKAYAIRNADDMVLLPGVVEAVQALKRAGLVSVVVTNQPDVGAGLVPTSVVEAIHARLGGLLPLDDVRVCYHTDADACDCRKPRPGMLLAAARRWDIDLANSFLVGDRWRDVDAGRAVGCTTFWIDRGYDEPGGGHADFTVASLAEAAAIILERLIPRRNSP